MTEPLVKIWYVSPQRLCNLACDYCVSTGDYAKSNLVHWKNDNDRENFATTVQWIAAQPFPVGVRLATLGEPFASLEFLEQAAWLTRQPNVRFVELLTNGTLLKNRLPRIAADADFTKLSLWATHHHTQVPVARFIDNLAFAQKECGLFVVANGLLFPDNADSIRELRTAAENAGLRFNLDPGYDPGTARGQYDDLPDMSPILATPTGITRAVELGADQDLLNINLLALADPGGRPCAAGHDYLFIGIDGEVYPCSRYYVQRHGRLGSTLDPGFRLPLRPEPYQPCAARSGCCNKEDFLNLQPARDQARPYAPSLGWTGP
ncbi:hypothetical protein [Streptomyces sp. NBC_01276]|uniref:hypothetical protein n=1 Tax=Streptomyces sp. NBC_01276 TaxID=2903808 RepID=UPI00352E6E8C